MKTQKLIITILLCLVLACKKESDNSSRCNIISIVQIGTAGNQAYTLTYNDEGKIATLDQTMGVTSHKDFSYNGNTMYVVTLDKDGHFSQKDSITLDGQQRPLNIRSFLNIDGSIWYNYTFEYNGDELKKYVQVNQSGNVVATSTLTYTNGNPISISFGNASSILDYYSDKKVQKGDYLEVATLIQYGISLYPHKNLVKTIASGGALINFSYEFNSNGLISKVTLTNGTDVSLLSYSYECE
jgi:hypothetical protein